MVQTRLRMLLPTKPLNQARDGGCKGPSGADAGIPQPVNRKEGARGVVAPECRRILQ